jgi:putative membrane protein
MSDQPHNATTGKTDPATYMALERTFLSWIRTAVALMGVGFAVARFGMYLRQMAATRTGTAIEGIGGSGISGVGVVAVSIVFLVLAVVRHIRTVRQLREGSWEPGISRPGIALALILAAMGIILVVYLLFLRE